MRNSTGTIVVSVMVGLWFLVSAVNGERAEPPRIYYEEIDKKDFPCYDRLWQFPLTRDKVFRSLVLTKKQREEIERLRKQFRDDLLDFKRRHNESLFNVLDDNQRRKLEEKRGEIDRYLEEKTPPWHYYRQLQPSNDEQPSNEDNWIYDLNLFFLEVGTNKKLMKVGVDTTTWGAVKKYFKE